jgi:spermidine synthase
MKPHLLLLIAVAIISGAALAYEILLMRLFSIIQWHHFAYMTISLALLGYGVSGVFLALNRDRLIKLFPATLMANMLLFSCSMPMCFILAQQIHFNPAEIVWQPTQLWNVCAIYLILALPFFFAANVVGLTLYYYNNHIPAIYAADLLGAGLGSVGVIVLLTAMFPEKILMALMLLGVAATLLASSCPFYDTKNWTVLSIVVTLAVLLAPSGSAKLQVSAYKSLNQLLQVPGTRVIDRYSSPLGSINVVKSDTTPLRYAPGLSLNATLEPPKQLGVFTDADNMTAITRYNGNIETLAYLDQTTSALPYHLKPLADILVLGAGTGSDVLQAHYHRADNIDAVELNPQIVKLMQQKYAEFSGGLYTAMHHIHVHIDEARGYLAGTDKTYDLVNLSLLDAFGASAAGLYSMAENYLYTDQAIREYLDHLSPDGYLAITRWVKIPPRDEAKVLATVIETLKNKGVKQPGSRIVMIRGWQTSTLIVKNGEITNDEITRLKQFCSERSFDPVHYPGISEPETNRFNIQQQPYLYQAASALLDDNSRAFIDAYKFNIEPATDDKPYLFHFFKWRTLPEAMTLLGTTGSFLLESGYLLLIAALVQAILASVVLIALPLWLWKSKLGIASESESQPYLLTYFFSLGLAFLFIEIAFIQKFILILHHPLYAITVVLSTFLLSAGCGSYHAAKYEKTALLPFAMIAMLSIVYSLGFQVISRVLLAMPDLSRYLFSIVLVIPLGFYMGMPFPTALAKISATSSAAIPWAWGINGCASVISAILATLIAMQFGFTVLIFMAVILYVLAAWCFPKLA